MENKLNIEQNADTDGDPAGGTVMGPGLDIRWQKGPLGRGLDRVGPNGAFVEDLLTAAIARLQFYQATRFRCREYAQAIRNLEEAMLWMRERTRRRESDGTEGTNQGA